MKWFIGYDWYKNIQKYIKSLILIDRLMLISNNIN